jgi:hypothetical protein
MTSQTSVLGYAILGYMILGYGNATNPIPSIPFMMVTESQPIGRIYIPAPY